MKKLQTFTVCSSFAVGLSARATRSRLIFFVALLERRKEDLLPAQGEGLFHILFGDVRKSFRTVDKCVNPCGRCLDPWHNALNGKAQVFRRILEDFVIKDTFAVHAINRVQIVLFPLKCVSIFQ